MTLQPFEYQRRTNIEEHNQMVEKINEIVDTINDNGLATDLPERVSELEQNAVTQDNRLTSETTARENMDTQLGRRIDTAFNNIIAFDGRITANETDIAGLKTDVGSLNTEMGGLSTEVGNIETEFNKYASKIRAVNGLHFTYNAGLTSANIDFTVEVECPESADPTAYRVCILEDPVGLLGKDVAKSITDFQIVDMATTEANVRTFKGRIVYDPSKLPEAYDTTFTNPTAIAVPSGTFSQDCWPNMTRMLNTESGGSGGFTPWVENVSDIEVHDKAKVGDLLIVGTITLKHYYPTNISTYTATDSDGTTPVTVPYIYGTSKGFLARDVTNCGPFAVLSKGESSLTTTRCVVKGSSNASIGGYTAEIQTTGLVSLTYANYELKCTVFTQSIGHFIGNNSPRSADMVYMMVGDVTVDTGYIIIHMS